MNKRRVAVGVLALAVLAPTGAAAKTRSAFGIVVQRCVLNESRDHATITGLNVVYYNSHQTPATEVNFLVNYRGKSYTLTDRGSFTHNAQIDHNLGGALSGAVWQGAVPELCIPGRVVFANGKILE